MSLTFDQARDEILTMFKTAWDTTGHIAVYTDVKGDKPTTQDPWARVSLTHSGGGQASLSGALGTSRFERTGLLSVQIFTPVGEGLSRAYSLSKIVADAYEGKASPGGVWFRNLRINEIGPDGDFHQVNVLVSFTYDEIK